MSDELRLAVKAVINEGFLMTLTEQWTEDEWIDAVIQTVEEHGRVAESG